MLTLDKVLAKYDLKTSAEEAKVGPRLLWEFQTRVDRSKLFNAITLIDKCVELGGDAAEDRAVIRSGICPELDKLRQSYAELDGVMASYITERLIPNLKRL